MILGVGFFPDVFTTLHADFFVIFLRYFLEEFNIFRQIHYFADGNR